MADVLGIDMLSNHQSLPEVQMGHLDTIDLPGLEPPQAPHLVPSIHETGPPRTEHGLDNLNAEPFFGARQEPRRMNEEHSLKEKYELLRKFERLGKAGVPMRKRFTLDSPLEEMKIELEFMRREKAADQTIKQFCDWYITAMSGLEWGSKNVQMMKAFGLNLEGLSESAQLNVGDMEEDFEELYDLYGDKLKMHPLVRIPIRTCMMVYMVHLTNQMARKVPIPNIDEVLRTNPDIARSLAQAAMQQQTQTMKAQAQSNAAQSAPVQSGGLSNLANFMSGLVPPPPPPQDTRKPAPIPTNIRGPVRLPQAPPAPPPAREMAPPANIDDLLKSVTFGGTPARKKGGSTGKNSVKITL
jgi:hypothetical protein